MVYLGQGGEDGHGLSEGRGRQHLIDENKQIALLVRMCS